MTTPPLEDMASVVAGDIRRLIDERVNHNNLLIKLLKNENSRLSTGIGEVLLTQKVPEMTAKWNEIKRHLTTMLVVQNKYMKPKEDLKIENCSVVLEKHLTSLGESWTWKLKYPEESTSGRHRKVFILDSITFMPSCCEDNEDFVRFLVDNKFIEQEII
jgi:hypothetical protein